MKIAELRSLPIAQALEQCNKLDAATRKQLFIDCPAIDHRTLLVLSVIENKCMDDGFFSGITQWDYQVVRAFLMKSRDRMTDAAKKSAAQTRSFQQWFYPEYKNIRNVRQRFCKVATDHGTMRPSDPLHHSLFSMNGYFGFQEAYQSAHTHTTCGLFVRACRAAIRILEPKLLFSGRLENWKTNTEHGVDPCITGPSHTGNIDYAARGQREPKGGDIFHIKTPGPQHSDDHVGIIVSHHRATNGSGDWVWSTVEGGQNPDGFSINSYERVVPLKNGKHWLGTRAVQKWIDLELLASSVPHT
jgi:hypothetical protein